jgi:UDP:flavonoid glycosyltransferase YjiC (YdhE family)
MFYTRTGVPVKLLWLRKVEFREKRIRPREIPEGSLRSLPPDPELELPRPSVAVAADCADVPPLRGQPGAARRPATVYFTLGTVFNLESGDLFERVLAGLAELEIDVVATVGAEIDPAELGPLPPHVRVERFLPQSEILSRYSAVVSHAGSGSVLGALAHGLPPVRARDGVGGAERAGLPGGRRAAPA